jgi:hypothetical protein
VILLSYLAFVGVILLCYLAFVGAVFWLRSERYLPWRSNLGENVARVVAGGLAACFAILGFALSLRAGGEAIAAVLEVLLIIGATMYLLGLLLWRREFGNDLRAAGWLFLCGPLLFPSTLTLTLPLAALLVIAVPDSSCRASSDANYKGLSREPR